MLATVKVDGKFLPDFILDRVYTNNMADVTYKLSQAERAIKLMEPHAPAPDLFYEGQRVELELNQLRKD